MITVALSQMVYFFCVEAPFTHGEDGIQAVPQGTALGLIDLSNPSILYVFVAAVFLFGFLAVQRTVNSPFGEILKAIRENEPRAVSLGYRALAVQARGLRPVGGARRACRRDQGDRRAERLADRRRVRDVGRSRADDAGRRHGHLLWPGGRRADRRPMQNYLAQFGEWVTVIQGVVFVACVLAFRRGIVGELAARAKISL